MRTGIYTTPIISLALNYFIATLDADLSDEEVGYANRALSFFVPMNRKVKARCHYGAYSMRKTTDEEGYEYVITSRIETNAGQPHTPPLVA